MTAKLFFVLFLGKEILIGVLPLFHVYGMFVNVMKGPLYGATSVLLEHFEPQLFLDTIKKYQVRMHKTYQ